MFKEISLRSFGLILEDMSLQGFSKYPWRFRANGITTFSLPKQGHWSWTKYISIVSQIEIINVIYRTFRNSLTCYIYWKGTRDTCLYL